MEVILFEKYQLQELKTKKKAGSERGDILQQFLEPININRISGKYPQVSISRLAGMLSHIPTKDLYYLLSICKDAGNRGKNYHSGFSKKFYWELKVQKDERKKTVQSMPE